METSAERRERRVLSDTRRQSCVRVARLISAWSVVVQNLFAWTNGQQSVYFGSRNGLESNQIEKLRGIRHLSDNTSHEIITYDDYLQPPLNRKPRHCNMIYIALQSFNR